MAQGMTTASLTIVFVIVIVFLVLLLLLFVTAKTREGYVDYKSTQSENLQRFNESM